MSQEALDQETLKSPKESAAYKEIAVKQAKRYIFLARVSWVLFIVCLVGFIYLFPKFNAQNLSGIEPVEVTVIDVSKTKVKVKNGGNYDFYDVTVSYLGKEYKLHDGQYPFTSVGYTGTAYLYKGEIYAMESGPATNTVLAKLYYVCLIGGFVLLVVAASMSPKAIKLKKSLKDES